MEMSKRDRVRRDWPAVLEAQAASGLTVAAFCRQEGINQSLFHRWRRRHPVAADGFVELRPVERQAAGSGITVVTDHGWRLELEPTFDAATLQRVLACLTPRGVCSP